jgi:hypothetical protein
MVSRDGLIRGGAVGLVAIALGLRPTEALVLGVVAAIF